MKSNDPQKQSTELAQSSGSNVSRRKFLVTGGAAATAFAVVPRHVLGGAGFVAPSEKVTVAYIGCGTQGLREMPGMLSVPEIQIVAVCDPVKQSYDYVDWSPDGLRQDLAEALKKPDWHKGQPGIAGGRDVAKEVIETYYATHAFDETTLDPPLGSSDPIPLRVADKAPVAAHLAGSLAS